MAITSETQRRYDPKKGGYAYFTLFRSSEKGERPEWAQDGDVLEENCEGGGNYECKRDAKGRIKWEVASDWDRQTGGGSSSGGSGSGGGAEKFVVTLTQDEQTEEWTADKTVAEIVAADAAGKIVVAKHLNSGLYTELPLNSAGSYQSVYFAVFIGLVNAGSNNTVVSVQCANEGSGDVIAIGTQQIPTSTNAPLIVTMTAGSTEGQLVGDKTYGEAYNAFTAGRSCLVSIPASGQTMATTAAEYTGNTYVFEVSIGGRLITTDEGRENDYITVTVGG